MLVNSLRAQEAILRASEYGHDYDATIDYGWGVGLASKPLLPYRCQAIMPSPTVSVVHAAPVHPLYCVGYVTRRGQSQIMSPRRLDMPGIICFHSRQSAASMSCRDVLFQTHRHRWRGLRYVRHGPDGDNHLKIAGLVGASTV
jgi:hypothetical protein